MKARGVFRPLPFRRAQLTHSAPPPTGSRWRVRDLTYEITKYPRLLTRAEVNHDIRKAFDVSIEFLEGPRGGLIWRLPRGTLNQFSRRGRRGRSACPPREGVCEGAGC